LLGFALAIAGNAVAVAQPVQDTATSSDAATTKPAHQTPDPQRQTARLSRKLQLTPAQAAKMGSAAKFYVGNGPRFKNGLKKIG